MDEQFQYNMCLAPLFLNKRNYGRQPIRVLFHKDFPIFFWAISSVGACLSAFSVTGRFRSPTSLIGSIARLQCTKLVVRWKAVYPRKYPTIFLPRCEHSGGKSEVEQAIIGHGIGLITCPLIFCEPTSKMTIHFVPQQCTGLKQGYQSEKTCTDQIVVCKIREEIRYRPSYHRALLDLISCKLPNAM